jgi:hypothetical protein
MPLFNGTCEGVSQEKFSVDERACEARGGNLIPVGVKIHLIFFFFVEIDQPSTHPNDVKRIHNNKMNHGLKAVQKN